MKLFRVTTLVPNTEDSKSEVNSFYVADDIRKVWNEISLDLADEKTEVLGIYEMVPTLKIL